MIQDEMDRVGAFPVSSSMDVRAGSEVIVVREIKDIEINQLDLCYAHTRVERPKERLALAASLERVGQLVPVIVTATLVLLDGYLRVKALTSLGHDTVRAEIWDIPEEEALGELLARCKSRPWDAMEEAGLLWELHHRHHLSQEKIAAMAGRTQGWVSARLALYRGLSDDLLAQVRKGSISTWTATRVIVPIARAIPEQGRVLMDRLATVSLSTREMALFFHHYKKANRSTRQRMVDDPALFVKSLRAKKEATEAGALREGPEGAWCRDLRVATHILARLARQVPVLFPPRSALDRRVLLTAFDDSRKQFTELEKEIRRHDDYGRNQAGHYQSSHEGSSPPPDQPDPQGVPEHGQTGNPRLAAIRTALPV
jgi:hypothetical protein